MTRSSLLILAAPLALAACDSKPAASVADATAAQATDGNAVAEYLAPFVTSDPAACFGNAETKSVDMLAKDGSPFGSASGATRVVIAIDGSGSMAGRVGSKSKLELAREATRAFVDGLPPSVEASLLVFGQQGNNQASGKARSCSAVDVLTSMSPDRSVLTAALGRVQAVGWTPLAAGLDRAAASFAANERLGAQIVYVVSDGQETCGGDPVAAAKRISQGNTRAIVNIIGFNLPSADAAALQAVAEAGGGRLIDIDSDATMNRTMAAIRESNRSNINLTRAGNARAQNYINAGAAVTAATICTGAIRTRETIAVTSDLTARETEGKREPNRGAVMAALDARHKTMWATLEAYRQRLLGQRDKANQAVDTKEAAAK